MISDSKTCDNKPAGSKPSDSAPSDSKLSDSKPSDSKPSDLLAISNLRVCFGSLAAVDGVSLSVGRGSIAAIVGESGSGKSVLARSVLGLAGRGSKTTGRIDFLGRDMTKLSEAELASLRGTEVSLMVQDAQSALNPVYRVGTQILETLALKHPDFRGGAGAWLPLFLRRGAARARMRGAAMDLLAEVGLDDPDGSYRAFPHQLSGGMRQRVMLAMAILGSPKLLIADEPTTALDVVIQKRILERLVESAKKRGSSVILISHDLHLVGELADSLIVLYAGRVMESGPAKEVLANPANPYTRDLLAVTPRVDTPKGSLRPIPGEVPPPGGRDGGCLFRSRCREADEGCAGPPNWREVAPSWHSLCRRGRQEGRNSPPAVLAA
jgi:oligopeptide/dipeptide ABC transporter ATP-binding protein